MTLAAVSLAWVFFRCARLDDSLHVVRQLAAPIELGTSLLAGPWLLVIALTLGVAWLADRKQLFARIDAAHWFWRGVVLALLLGVLTVFAASEGHVAFIYFQF